MPRKDPNKTLYIDKKTPTGFSHYDSHEKLFIPSFIKKGETYSEPIYDLDKPSSPSNEVSIDKIEQQ